MQFSKRLSFGMCFLKLVMIFRGESRGTFFFLQNLIAIYSGQALITTSRNSAKVKIKKRDMCEILVFFENFTETIKGCKWPLCLPYDAYTYTYVVCNVVLYFCIEIFHT